MNFLKSLKTLFSLDLAVDMGTTRTKIYEKTQEMVLNEPSFVAVSYREGEVQAVGREAYKMYGRCPPHVEVHQPLEHGVIENFDLAEEMLKRFLDQVFNRKALLGARIAMVVPSGATDVEKKAFEDIAVQVGGREVMLVEAPIAAAIGMNLPIGDGKGTVAFYLGGGTTQAAVFIGGDLMLTHCNPVGGEDLTEAIINGVRKNHQILIGSHTAEQLKISMGSAYPSDRDESREIYGKSVVDGLPRAVFVANWEIREMMEAPLNQIVNTMKSVLEKVPPDLSEDIKKSGLFLSGGNAQVEGFSRLVEHITGLKCVKSKKGQMSCIRGAAKIIMNSRKYRDFTTSSHSRQFNA